MGIGGYLMSDWELSGHFLKSRGYDGGTYQRGSTSILLDIYNLFLYAKYR